MQQPTWLKQFLRWLRSVLGAQTKALSVTIQEQYHNGSVSVLRLNDPTIPGAVSLWRIDYHHERIKFFICVINVAKLRAELPYIRDRAASAPSRRGLAGSLWQQISAQVDVLATHYWITGWDRETAGTDIHGRYYRSHRVSGLNLLAVDLQGTSGPFAADRYAVRYAREAIKRLAANEFGELAHHRCWVKAVQSIDWLDWLAELSRSPKGGISIDHVLQPKRRSSPGRHF